MTVLLERDREVGEIEAALEEVTAGRGRAVAIEASAGLGKTRLLQEARDAGARAGLKVLAGRATELEQDFPFALVRQLLESEIANLPGDEREGVLEGASAARAALGLDPDPDRGHDSFAVLHGLYWVTAALAERRPLLLAIDDGHSADAASLDYLGFLLPRLEELSVLLVVTGRPDEPDPSGGFRRLMSDSVVRHLTLAPLSAEATNVLLAQEFDDEPTPQFAAACFEVSGGNPFLLRELIRTLVQRGIEPLPEHSNLVRELVPERVAHTVLMRIERLLPEAGTVARSIAVLGEGCDLRLVAEFAGVDVSAAASATDALRASAILDGSRTLRFIHPLVRNAIYESVPAGERMALHSRAARHLREAGSTPELIATQLLAGEARGERENVETLIEAGARASASGAPRSAIAYLSRAFHEPAPSDLQAAVLESLLSAIVAVADTTAFSEIEAEVFAAIDRDPPLLSRLVLTLAGIIGVSGRFDDAASLLRSAFERAVEQDDVEFAYILGVQHNTIASLAGPGVQLDLGRYADQVSRNSPAGHLVAAIEARSAVADGSSEEAADAAKRALHNAAILLDVPDVAAGVTAVMTLVVADDLAPAREAVERSLAITRQRGATGSLVRELMVSSLVSWGEGDLVRAEPDMRQAIELGRAVRSVPLWLSITPIFMEILIERDELEAAERELETTGISDGPLPKGQMFSLFFYARGHLRLERGEHALALEDLSVSSYPNETLDFGRINVSFASPLVARALKALGDRRRGRELADSLEPLARRWGSPSAKAHLLRARAAAGEGEKAIRDLEEAAALLEGSPRRLERTHTLVELGEALRGGGRRADARPPLQAALELARKCGAVRIAKRAHDELKATGATVRRYTPIGVESLTPSERRVAELAASGMTNRQIAQSLFVTVKTVEAHLSAAYDKLDISSRRQLPDALGGRGA
ncbi:MAG TPA: AAA family ATPase [Solirubrobacterales bacterium]|nr:AAA family ATPase [Solirubrobacterales bacterium]